MDTLFLLSLSPVRICRKALAKAEEHGNVARCIHMVYMEESLGAGRRSPYKFSEEGAQSLISATTTRCSGIRTALEVGLPKQDVEQ